jgi:hypothetical protein
MRRETDLVTEAVDVVRSSMAKSVRQMVSSTKGTSYRVTQDRADKKY